MSYREFVRLARACLAVMIPDPVKAIIASFGLSVDFGPGASP